MTSRKPVFALWVLAVVSACAMSVSIPAKELSATASPNTESLPYPQARFPELTPVEIGKRFLKLIDSVKSPEDFTEERLQEMRLPFRPVVGGTEKEGFFSIRVGESDWSLLFSYDMVRTMKVYYEVSNQAERKDRSRVEDGGPICGLDFKAYTTALKQMGFILASTTNNESGHPLEYSYVRNSALIIITPRWEKASEGSRPINERHECVKDIRFYI